MLVPRAADTGRGAGPSSVSVSSGLGQPAAKHVSRSLRGRSDADGQRDIIIAFISSARRRGQTRHHTRLTFLYIFYFFYKSHSNPPTPLPPLHPPLPPLPPLTPQPQPPPHRLFSLGFPLRYDRHRPLLTKNLQEKHGSIDTCVSRAGERCLSNSIAQWGGR